VAITGQKKDQEDQQAASRYRAEGLCVDYLEPINGKTKEILEKY